MQYRSHKSAFTLIEMLIVVVIIGLLSTALVPKIQSSQARSRNTIRIKDIQTLNIGIKSYGEYYNTYPVTLRDMTEKTLSSIPQDPQKLEYCMGAVGYKSGDYNYLSWPNGWVNYGSQFPMKEIVQISAIMEMEGKRVGTTFKNSGNWRIGYKVGEPSNCGINLVWPEAQKRLGVGGNWMTSDSSDLINEFRVQTNEFQDYRPWYTITSIAIPDNTRAVIP